MNRFIMTEAHHAIGARHLDNHDSLIKMTYAG